MKQSYIQRKKKSFRPKTKDKAGATSEELGMYPVHSAIQNNDLGALEALINSGVNLNKYNLDKDTPLLLAVKDNNYQIVEKLLEEGADLYKPDANQNSPIEVAISLDYQECVDILTEAEALRASASNKNGVRNEKDDSLEFVTELIKILHEEIVQVTNSKKAEMLGGQVLALLQQYLNLGGVSEEVVAKLNADITNRITQFTSFLENNAKILNKDILNLARKIICIIHDSRKSLSVAGEWTLSKIESLIEEKIVLSNASSPKITSHIFVPNSHVKQGIVATKERDEDWYVKNGYKDFDEFIRIHNSGAGSLKFLKFSNVVKENILQKTNCHSTERMTLVTIKPLKLKDTEGFSLLLQEGLKRIKEEESLFDQPSLELQACATILDKTQKGESISSDESLQLDKILRPGKQNKMHIVHFHHTNQYESSWNDLAEEAFITGATVYLFNPPSKSTKPDFIYSGMAIINKLLDEDVHPDKIILQSYGDGHGIAKEVKNQFQRRGIELTQVNYQHSSFAPSYYPDFICDHRHMHIYEQLTHKQNILNKESNLQEFSKFAKYIAKHLAKISYSKKSPSITSAASEDYPLPQLINSFITASQYFLKNHISYKNPVLPEERVESILGMADI